MGAEGIVTPADRVEVGEEVVLPTQWVGGLNEVVGVLAELGHDVVVGG